MSWFFSKTEGLDPETIVWRDAIIANSGTFESDSIDIADALIKAIKASAFDAKIKYLLPWLGSDAVAVTRPLRDALGAGFASGGVTTFSQATGMQGNGTSDFLNTKVKPSQLGSSNNGGMGYWENSIDFTGTSVSVPMGCTNISDTTFFMVQTHSTVEAGIFWGDPANSAVASGTGINGHYYAQRSSATSREAFFNGVSKATNTTSDAASGAEDREIWILARDQSAPIYWKGRCACAYLTDGTLSGTEVADLHTLLGTYLITPTGR